MNLAVILARGGSKRIPRKNIRPFRGKPILAYSIEAALEASCFDEVMVSTEDAAIADTALKWGAAVPFMRSQAAATDLATTVDVIDEVIGKYESIGVKPDFVCCIYPTAPFITARRIAEGMKMLVTADDASVVFPVVRFSFPIQRALRMSEGRLVPFQSEHIFTRSQDLEPAYHDAGQFYCLKVREFKSARSLIVSGSIGILLNEWEVQDIDSEDDWIHAELKYDLIQRRI